MKHATVIFTRIALCGFLATAVAFNSTADEKGQSIIRKVDATEISSSSKMLFSMAINPSDGSSARNFSVLSYENPDGNSLIEFTEPRTVRGLKILSKGSSSWVFFPSTGRIRKIGGASRSGSVQGVGGDFSYDDLGSGTWEADYDFSILSETGASWELEGKKKAPDATYDSVKVTVSKDTYRMTKSIFALASEGGYFKQLTLSDFKDYSGNTRASLMVMKNLKKESSTEIRLQEAQFNLKLDERLFDPARFQQ